MEILNGVILKSGVLVHTPYTGDEMTQKKIEGRILFRSKQGHQLEFTNEQSNFIAKTISVEATEIAAWCFDEVDENTEDKKIENTK